MGAIVIGIGAALAVLGVVFGAIGFGSAETTSGAALMTVGGTGFVGGLLIVALGFILRVLSDIAEKLEGAVHFEPFEDEVPAGRMEAATMAREAESLVPVSPDFAEPSKAPLPRAPLELPPDDEEREPPAWFLRKRPAELPADAEPGFATEPDFEPEPLFEPEPDFEPLPPFRSPLPEPVRPEPPRAEPVRPEPLRPAPLRPDVAVTEPVRPEPPRSEIQRPEPARREPPAFLRPGAGIGAPGERPVSAPVGEARPPRLRDELPAEPDDTPPAFLQEADLLADEAEPESVPAAPSVTVLKSGTIGGMSYKLYSDGSIEADLPDGTLRFASLQELRDHVAGGMPRE